MRNQKATILVVLIAALPLAGTGCRWTSDLFERCEQNDDCAAGEYCNPDKICEDVCAGKECGTVGTVSCGTCDGLTEFCAASWQCEDGCAGKECGPGEGGVECGSCEVANQEYCSDSGQCADGCAGRECGPGEGGVTCGSCDGATPYCAPDGHCVSDPGALLPWVAIPGGGYQMGSMAWSYTQPVHAVTVGAFELTKTEVTVSQYAACVTAGACTAPATGNQCNWEVAGYEEHPVNCVDWDQSRAFCTWAGGRLATEAEWGHAARSGGQEIDYPWGNEMATCVYAVMYEGGSGCGTGRTMAVCSKPAGNSAQGVCDLAGNVREWVEDDWHGAYTGAPANGSAWIDNPRGSARVVRCGSLSSDDHHLRASFRYFDDPSVQHYGLGLRCAR